MKIPLKALKGERQQTFLDYLRAALRKESPTTSGSAGYERDGTFKREVVGAFRVGDSPIQLRWKIRWFRDGSIPFLTIDSLNDPENKSGWEQWSHDLVTDVLVRALAGVVSKFFRRAAFVYMGTNLDGEYWLPGFR